MKSAIIKDVKTVMQTRRLWIAVGLIIVCSVINTISMFAFEYDVPKGFLGIFIYADVRGNSMMNFLAPFIPAFVIGPLAVNNMKFDMERREKTEAKIKMIACSISSVITGIGIFIVANVIFLAGCYFFDPTIQETKYIAAGLFSEVYKTNMPMYVVLFILYSSLFGAVYSLFSMSIGIMTRSQSMAMVLPGLIYQASYMMWVFVDNPILSWLNVFLPSFTYEFTAVKGDSPMLTKAAGLGCVVLASIVMLIIAYRRLKRIPHKLFCEERDKAEEPV